jgi:hypothetical protein
MIPSTANEGRRPAVHNPGGASEPDVQSLAARPRPAPPAELEEDQLLTGVFEVNERCLEMLVSAARQEPKASFALVSELRELLKSADPAVRCRAARCRFLLVDLEFGNSDWWRGACSPLSEQTRLPSWRGSFPSASGAQLARITLLVAWNSLRATPDPAMARLLLGMTDEVGELIANLRLDQVDRIAQKRFRFVRPRWEDRPAVWRRLLLAARAEDTRLMAEFNVHALQLLAGELLGPAPGK